jgi:hypothetical protein
VHLAVVALIAVLAQSPPSPSTAEAKAKAQALLTDGAALYESGNAAGALRKFTAAYAAYPSPKLWLNIGQAQRDLARPVEALEAFQRFIAEVSDPPPEALAEANASVAELQLKLGRLIIDCPTPGAEVALDGKSVGRTPLPGSIWTTPGRHHLSWRRPGWVPLVETVAAEAGQVRRVVLHPRLVDLSAPKPRPRQPDVAARAAPAEVHDGEAPFYARWPFWAALGGAVVVGGIVIAATSGHSTVPSTALGAQNAF